MASKYNIQNTEFKTKHIRRQTRGIVSDVGDVGMDLIIDNTQPEPYCVNFIGMTTKYAYSVFIKDKTSGEIDRALKEYIGKFGAPTKLCADMEAGLLSGKVQQTLKKYNIELYHTNTLTTHNPITEIYNKTQKNNVEKMKDNTKTKDWVPLIESFNNIYNNTIHSTIKMKPIEAHNDPNKAKQAQQQMINLSLKPRKEGEIYNVGDKVKLQRVKGHFEKKSTPQDVLSHIKFFNKEKNQQPYNQPTIPINMSRISKSGRTIKPPERLSYYK